MLATHPAVREAVVDARAVGDDKRLVAWVVPAADVAEETLAARCGSMCAALPDYMVPSARGGGVAAVAERQAGSAGVAGAAGGAEPRRAKRRRVNTKRCWRRSGASC